MKNDLVKKTIFNNEPVEVEVNLIKFDIGFEINTSSESITIDYLIQKLNELKKLNHDLIFIDRMHDQMYGFTFTPYSIKPKEEVKNEIKKSYQDKANDLISRLP